MDRVAGKSAQRAHRAREILAHPLIVFPLVTGGLAIGVVDRASPVLWLTVAVVAGYSLSGSV
jgi:hypothetical protein